MLLTVPVNWPLGLTYFSSNWLASPLLSPLIKWFVLFMEVGWTANQLITPIGSFVSEWNMFIWWTPWSVSCSYLQIKPKNCNRMQRCKGITKQALNQKQISKDVGIYHLVPRKLRMQKLFCVHKLMILLRFYNIFF